MSLGNSFNGDLFPPSPPQRKKQKTNEGGSYKGRTNRTDPLPRPNRTLLSNGTIYHTYQEFQKGQTLAREYPDTFWMKRAPIRLINSDHPLELFKSLNLTDINVNNERGWGFGGHMCGLSFSSDGELMVGASILGSCFIWDAIQWKIIKVLRDPSEPEIEELYRTLFSKDSRQVFTCGKLKSRSTWSEEDGDNFCIPGKIKIYDILSGKVLLQLEGHQEEILCMKLISFMNNEYLISGGQDGRIIKWKINEEFTSFEKVFIDDLTTHYVCALAMLPKCGNKFFVAGCDEGVKIFDLERNVLVESFPDLYSSFCDVVKFVHIPLIPLEEHESLLITRGVELLDATTNKQTRTNKCHLWKLCGPTKNSQNFILEPIRIFEHAKYEANTWLMDVGITSRYLLAPTTTGKVFVWNMLSGQLVSIICPHSDCIRDVAFHPLQPQIITCGDDSIVQIFKQNEESEKKLEEEEEEEEEEESSDISDSENEVETKPLAKKEGLRSLTEGYSPQMVNIPSSMSIAMSSPKGTLPPPQIPLPVNNSYGDESSSELGEDSSSDSSGDD